VNLHGKTAREATVLVDTTVQEKAATYPTDSKLLIKIVNRFNKLVQEAECFALYQRAIDQRRSDKKEAYSLHESEVYCVGNGKDHKAYE
jgi:hypothetical protein